MAWLSIDENGFEEIYEYKPERQSYYWWKAGNRIELPQGTIEKIL